MRSLGVVAVAYSGGRDSTALAHATAVSAELLGLRVVALHVHHGLSKNADGWVEHCAAQCRDWAVLGLPVEFCYQRLDGSPAKGDSVESWAREGRLQALRGMALSHGASLVLLAHHRRDQAETFMLQALRGAGVAGLAGMPRVAEREGLTWARPWLDRPRDDIDVYVRRHRLEYIDDESNEEPRFARNRLRLHLWPEIVESFAQAETSLAAAASWAQEAHAALGELAAMDLADIAGPHGIDLPKWQFLSAARRSNALRAWLRAQTGAPASAALVQRLQDELPLSRNSRWSVTDHGELRAYRGVLSYSAQTPRPEKCIPRESCLRVLRAGVHRLPGWQGRLHVVRVTSGGVPLGRLAQLEVRPREGAERFQCGIGRPPRSLKKQYQAAGVPSWARNGPLFYSGGQLVFVPGLGLDARVLGLPGQALVDLCWLPLDASVAPGPVRGASRPKPAG